MKVSLAEMTQREKLELMEELWADLTRQPDEIESPGWHREELEATSRRVESGEEKTNRLGSRETADPLEE
jgi:hypothetical protein